MKPSRIGVAVSRGEVRAVVREGALVRRSTHAWSDPAELPGAVRNAILDVAPGRRFRKRAVIAVDAGGVQVKRISTDGPAVVSLDDIRRNVRRHFLVGSHEPILVSTPAAAGVPLEVAAFDAIECEAIRVGCSHAGTRVAGFIPEAQSAVIGGRFSESVSTEFHAALGACAIDLRRTSLLLDIQRLPNAHAGRWRLAAAGIALLMTAGLAAVAPGLRSRQFDRANRLAIAPISQAAGDASRSKAALLHSSREVAELEAFARSRRSMTFALAALTEAVPGGSMATDVRFDSAGGSFVLIGQQAAGIVAELAVASAFSRPALVGAVTPQQLAAGRVERATVRFLWPARR